MPPKAKYTKEQIIDAAFNLIRQRGITALSARSLAKALGTSTGPIFTSFNSIEEVQNEVLNKTKALYSKYIQAGLQQTPAFKGAGLKYIQFAKDEPELFKFLFTSGSDTDKFTHFLPACDENAPLIENTIMRSHNLSAKQVKNLYNHLAVYAFGLATLFAQKQSVFTMDDVSQMLSEVFTALIKEAAEK